MAKSSKRYKNLIKINKDKKFDNLEKIIDNLKSLANTKFDESIDVSFKVNIKKLKSSESTIRTVIELPNGNGKKVKIAVLCDENKLSEAKKSGADIFGSDDLIKKISSGDIKFNKLICTPSMIPKVGKLGKILGPKGLMPNPKLGTVTNDIKSTVKSIKTGQIEIKSDKDGNLSAGIGKKSFPDIKIKENFDELMQTVTKEKPTTIKGNFVLGAYLTSTMGVSYKIKI